MQPHVAGILLAAGEGSRLGQPKALVEIAGQRLVDRGVCMLRAGGADPVVVVTGAAPVDVPGALVLHNPAWPTGMGSSLTAGLSALRTMPPDECSAAVIALADQPLVSPECVKRLIAAHRGDAGAAGRPAGDDSPGAGGAPGPGAAIAVAAYGGRPRNPVLIAREHWAEVLTMARGDAGARPFLRAHPDLVTLVECGDTGRPDDVDTPEDLSRVAKIAAQPNLSWPALADAPAPGGGRSRVALLRPAAWPGCLGLAQGGPNPFPEATARPLAGVAGIAGHVIDTLPDHGE